MVNTVEYKLKYRKKGAKFEKNIVIDFVPNKRHSDYIKIQNDILNVQTNWNQIKILEEEIKLLFESKPDNYKDDIKFHQDKIEELSEDIRILSEKGEIIKKRTNLLKEILIDNGYGKDNDLMSDEFWDNCVDPKDINEIITLSMTKDAPKKKQMK